MNSANDHSPTLPAAVALPPETLEGWYALHQIFSIDRDAVAAYRAAEPVASVPPSVPDDTNGGWTAFAGLIGARAGGEIMAMHFRPTLDAVGEAQREFARLPVMAVLRPVYSFLSVTEAGLYHLTAQLARAAAERGGTTGDDIYRAEMATRVAAEQASAHVRRRLYPPLPEDMPYVCFYPMTKRRDAGQNWYTLSLEERSRLMHSHGVTGRRYAGRVLQIITGAIGLDAWEWGVTLFAKDPLDFKKLVTDMRFDEVSAKYAEFGDFYVGRIAPAPRGGEADALESLVETIVG